MKKMLFISALAFFAISALNAQNEEQPAEKRTQVQITTPEGEIVIELYNETPVHRDNFIKLVNEKFYDSTLFHRCIRSFMIQGGDPDSRNAKPGQALGMGDINYTLPAEFRNEFVHTRGAVAAARLGDNANPDKRSSGCQFYIVQGQEHTREQINKINYRRFPAYTPEQIDEYVAKGGTPHLDGAYTVFGRVVSGLDVVEKISRLEADQYNRPYKDIRMTMKIVEK